MNISREDVIDKIKKLLALAGSKCNENEAISAALKAQRLIAEYDVTDKELDDDASNWVIDSIFSDKAANRVWRSNLAQIIAENFRCKTAVERRGRNYYPVFFGYRNDARAALLIFEFLYSFGNKKASELTKNSSNRRADYNTYTFAFCAGVRRELEQQSKVLKMVVPESVEAAFNEMGLSKRHTRSRTLSGDKEIFEQGLTDGREAVRSRRVEKPTTNHLLDE
jgi:hypothetical protein